MKKNLSALYIFAALILLLSRKADAQVTFTDSTFPYANFTAGQATVLSGNVAILPARSESFSVTVYRPSGSNSNGYVDIYSGITGPVNLLSNNIGSRNPSSSNNTNAHAWNSPSGGYESYVLLGTFDTGQIASNHLNLYAVYFNNISGNPTQEAISQPIALTPGISPPPPPPSGPTAPSNAIQCIDFGATPLILNAANYSDVGNFSGYDRIIWMVSTDGVNYSQFTQYYGSGASSSYQPLALYKTTYFYAKGQFSECDYLFFGCHWRTLAESYIFKISVKPRVPVLSSSVNYACASVPTTITINPQPEATSFNWKTPGPGWTINGWLNGGLLNTPSLTATFTPPASAVAGTYYAHVSAFGDCGGESADATIPIVVATGSGLAVPSGARWIKIGSSCSAVYSLVMPTVPRATYYQAVSSSGSSAAGTINSTGTTVTFYLDEAGPASYITATVTAYGCGSSSYVTPSSSLAGPPLSCTKGTRVRPNNEEAVYPNPANQQIMVSSQDQAAQIILYDITGVLRRTIQLKPNSGQTAIDVRNLPAGLYHLQMIINGQAPINRQIQIEH